VDLAAVIIALTILNNVIKLINL